CQTLTGPWQVQFDPNWGGPERVTFLELIDWAQHPDVGVRYYSGKATYTCSFNFGTTIEEGKRLLLDLGCVHEVAAVRVNGQALGVLWNRPLRVNINETVKAGLNRLEIDVVNLWPNRLIGDSLLPDDERFTQTNIRKFTPKSKLLPSGLLGPVTIKREGI
ncbi:glycosylhydrolase-like jelly roll fold domain-containing protein, partial [Planctomycetota bacterium]